LQCSVGLIGRWPSDGPRRRQMLIYISASDETRRDAAPVDRRQKPNRAALLAYCVASWMQTLLLRRRVSHSLHKVDVYWLKRYALRRLITRDLIRFTVWTRRSE